MKENELTLEQLEDMEEDLLQIEEQKDGHYAQLIISTKKCIAN